MLLGGSIASPFQSASEWAELVRRSRYKATVWPLSESVGASETRAYVDAAREMGVCLAEVGVWRNTLSPDDAERKANVAYAKERLALAEEIGARCCVNIAGARGALWDGGYADNYAADTYALLVDSVRDIIDAVKPARTFYTLEPLPWMTPDSPDAYLRLIRDVDRPAFGVHMDFVNMINTPARFLLANAFIASCFSPALAPHIRSVHLKDVAMDPTAMPVVLRECPPGQGMLDIGATLRTIDRSLPKDTPVLLEHMRTMAEYDAAFAHVEAAAQKAGVTL